MQESNFQNDFMIEEYKSLRSEIQNSIDNSRRIIYYNIVFNGIIWSFYLTENLNFDLSIKWVPLLITFFSAFYNYSIGRDIKRVGDYIHKIENEKFPNIDLGWEKHLRKQTIGWNSMTDLWEYIFWICLAIINLLAALMIE